MPTQNSQQPKPVTCATCRHFVRDTSGPSYNIYTHIYFMGTCNLALTPHSPIKQFADHPHICPHHQPNHQPQQPLSAAQTKTINQFN